MPCCLVWRLTHGCTAACRAESRRPRLPLQVRRGAAGPRAQQQEPAAVPAARRRGAALLDGVGRPRRAAQRAPPAQAALLCGRLHGEGCRRAGHRGTGAWAALGADHHFRLLLPALPMTPLSEALDLSQAGQDQPARPSHGRPPPCRRRSWRFRSPIVGAPASPPSSSAARCPRRRPPRQAARHCPARRASRLTGVTPPPTCASAPPSPSWAVIS